MIDRDRKVNIENKTAEEIEQLSTQLGEKTAEFINNAVIEADKILNIYGLEVMARFEIAPKGTKESLAKEQECDEQECKPEE